MRTALYLALLSLALGTGCRRERTDLHVLSRAPEGQLGEAGVQELRVTFDRPMVPAALVGKEAEAGPLTLEPPAPGKHLWLDQQTLLYRTAAPLPRSTQYRVALAGDLRALDGSRTAAPVRYAFTTQRLEVTDLLPAERRFLGPRERLTLRFSQPVVPSQVAARCLLTGGAGGPVALPVADEEEGPPRQAVALVPAAPLGRGADYQLQCDAALSGAEGKAGMAAPYATALHTYGDLTVTSARPSGGAVDSDDLSVEIEFSNPITREELRAHLASKPRIAHLDDGWLEGQDRRKYTVRVSLEPGTSYEVKVSAGMKDAFGQALGKDHVFFFTAGDAKPRLSMSEGTYVVEAQPGRYPLWTRNVTHLDVTCARVPEDRVVPLLERARESEGDTEGEGGPGDDGKEDGDKLTARWRKLGLKPASKRVVTSGVKNKWQDGALDLASLAGGDRAGLFVARVAAEEAKEQGDKVVTANVTNLGLVAKTGPAGGLLWAVHLSDGKPAGGVKVAVRSRDNKVRFSGVTAADGTLALPAASALADRRGPKLRSDEAFEMENGAEELLYVLAREGADLAVLSGSWRDGLYSWNFNLPSRPPAGRVRGFIQSDRGLYRPGEVVHLRGLARALRLGEGLVLPREKQLTVLIEDPRGDEVLKRVVTLSPFGGFSLDLSLPPAARLGDWTVTATIGKGGKDGAEETFRDHFSVEEYRPAAFEVTLKPQKKVYQLGDKVRVDLQASYLYGAPLGKGHVTFSVRRRDHLPTFPRYEEFSFSDLNAMEDLGYYWARYGERSYSYDETDKEAELDKGRASLRFKAGEEGKDHKTAQDYLIEASVTDESNQSRTAQVALIAHRSPFYLGLHATEYVPEANKPFVVQAVAVGDDGKERAVAAELVVTLREWKCDYSQAQGGYYGSYQCQDKSTELERRKVQLAAGGATALPVTVRRAGTILLSLRAPDGRGHEVVASDQVWAVGKGEASWRVSEGAKIPLQANKRRYRPGDTALLVAQAPLSGGTALVTVEREGIISHRVQPFASAGTAIPVEITGKYAPNVYASVVIVRGRTGDGEQHRPAFGMGLVDLEVDAGEKRLQVAVTSDRPSYRPGETVRARVVVKDQGGAPVSAEVALAVADEGVLQLIGYKTPDPQASFYAPYGLGVTTATSWNRLARRNDPNEDTEGEGGDSGASAGKVRDKFVSTAFWAPALVTGADGGADVTFQAPDNLTAFRLMAVVADGGDRFGHAEGRFTVAKPLQAVPALPRFLVAGDRLQVGVVLHNQTPAGGAVTVTAAAEGTGAELRGDRRREVQVPAGGEKLALFDLRAPEQGEQVKLTFTAALGAERDAVAVTVPVLRPRAQESALLGEGEAQAGAEVTIPVALPKEAQGADVIDGALEVVLDPVGLGGIDEGLRYLINYPYGCLEQTTSQVIPMVKVEDLARSLDLPGLRGQKLRGFVEAGVAKVLRHQHEDGAFSLWPGSGAEPFLTAYALYGLSQVKRAGYAVPEKSLTQGIDALKQGLGERRGMGTSDNFLGEGGSRAFALYVLAELGRPDLAAMEKLAGERATLPVFGKALLGRALKRGGGDRQLLSLVQKDVEAAIKPMAGLPGAARAEDADEGKLAWYFSSDVRTSALVLSMLLEVDPAHAAIPQLVKGLLAVRKGGRWENTQDNLFSLVALSDYARGKARRAERGGAVKVALGSRVLLDGAAGRGKAGKGAKGAAALPIQRLTVPLYELKAGAPLSILASGAPMGYTARLRYGRSLSRAPAAASGFRLERRLLDGKSGQPVKALRAGDLLRVELRVRADGKRSRIALVDHLPAGLEPINPRLSVKDPAAGEDRPDDEDRWDAMEMHDDRVAVFADELAAGQERVLSYLARVTSAGTFLWPSATVEEMYHPEVRARTESGALEVRPR